MKDVKEALYCMGQMADKCLTSLGAIQKDYNEFVSLVRRMREAQKESENISERMMCIRKHGGVLTDKDFMDVASAVDRVVDLESEVDEYLKKMEI